MSVEVIERYHPNGQLERRYGRVASGYHGKYISYYTDGSLLMHCYYENGFLHGEYKRYLINNAIVIDHYFFCKNQDISLEVKSEFNVKSLTEEDKLVIALKWGIPCL